MGCSRSADRRLCSANRSHDAAGCGRRGGYRKERQITLGQQGQMQEAHAEEHIGEATAAGIKERHRDGQQHERFKVNHHRRMEIHRLKFRDVL